MTTLPRCAAAAALLLSILSASSAVEVGDEVCLTGYIMDQWCIEETGGTLLDDSSVITLQHPEEHSFHCLLDVGVCRNSGFVVLGDKNPDTDRHCLGYRIDDTDAVVEAGRAAGKRGYCSSCTNEDDEAPEYGYRATVRGIVESLGDGSDGVSGAPVLGEVELLDAGVGCGEEEAAVPPLCARALGTEDPTPVPSPSPTPAPMATETGSTPGPALSCPDTLDESYAIDPSATLYYAVVPSDPADANNGLFCARLEVENDGWVGLALSETRGMAGSTGIVGVPAEGTVLKYDLYSYGVTPAPDARQTLMDASLVQDEDGMTIMSFSKFLVEDGDVSIAEDTNTFLHARGGEALGYHGGSNRFVFDVDLGASGPVTESPTTKPSASPVTESPTMKPSASPITESPTMKPSPSPVSESPTMKPSISPVTDSAAPTTLAPTAKPSTLAPATDAPSKPATVDPTDEPTLPPVASETNAPSASAGTNSTSPTASPTPAPFAFTLETPPTALPTATPPTASTPTPTLWWQAATTPSPVSSASPKSMAFYGALLTAVAGIAFW